MSGLYGSFFKHPMNGFLEMMMIDGGVVGSDHDDFSSLIIIERQ